MSQEPDNFHYGLVAVLSILIAVSIVGMIGLAIWVMLTGR